MGSTANTKPPRSAASATRWVTTPASVQTVATGWSIPDSVSISTSVIASSFSVLMTALFQVNGIAPPVYPVPPPRGMMVRPRSIQPFTKPAISTSESGVSTTKGYSTRQSVASVTWETRLSPSNLMLSLAVNLPSVRDALRRRLPTSTKAASNDCTARCAAVSNSPTMPSRSRSACGVRRFSTSVRRWFSASTSRRRRLGLSSKSSCR